MDAAAEEEALAGIAALHAWIYRLCAEPPRVRVSARVVPFDLWPAVRRERCSVNIRVECLFEGCEGLRARPGAAQLTARVSVDGSAGESGDGGVAALNTAVLSLNSATDSSGDATAVFQLHPRVLDECVKAGRPLALGIGAAFALPPPAMPPNVHVCLHDCTLEPLIDLAVPHVNSSASLDSCRVEIRHGGPLRTPDSLAERLLRHTDPRLDWAPAWRSPLATLCLTTPFPVDSAGTAVFITITADASLEPSGITAQISGSSPIGDAVAAALQRRF